MKRFFRIINTILLLLPVFLLLAAAGDSAVKAEKSTELHPWFVYGYEVEEESGSRNRVEEYLESFGNYGVVSINGGRLFVRKTPSRSGEVVAWLKNGGIVTILGTAEGDGLTWYRIRSGDFSEVYAAAPYVRTGKEAVEAALSVIGTRVSVNAAVANLRSEPFIPEGGDNRVGSVSKGAVLNLSETPSEDPAWFKVQCEGGDAYISADCADYIYELPPAEAHRELTVAEQRKLIVEEALKCVGNPYVWGGESLTNGTDCSGLVLILYREIAGIELIHYSTCQANYGREISVSELQPGDLLFYVTMGGTRISHVAIYIGDGKVVQAYSTEVGIIVSPYDFLPPVKCVNLLD